MVVLMMRNGLIDPNHEWRVMDRGVGLDSLDVFLWACITEEEKAGLDRGKYPETLDLLGSPPIGSEKLLDDQEERSG